MDRSVANCAPIVMRSERTPETFAAIVVIVAATFVTFGAIDEMRVRIKTGQ